jgi:hypothetical protein
MMPKHLNKDLCFWWNWTLSQEHLSDLSGCKRFCNLISEGYDIDPCQKIKCHWREKLRSPLVISDLTVIYCKPLGEFNGWTILQFPSAWDLFISVLVRYNSMKKWTKNPSVVKELNQFNYLAPRHNPFDPTRNGTCSIIYSALWFGILASDVLLELHELHLSFEISSDTSWAKIIWESIVSEWRCDHGTCFDLSC